MTKLFSLTTCVLQVTQLYQVVAQSFKLGGTKLQAIK